MMYYSYSPLEKFLTAFWLAACLAFCVLSFAYGSAIFIPENLHFAPDGSLWFVAYGMLALIVVIGGIPLGAWDKPYFTLAAYGFLFLSAGLFIAMGIPSIQTVLFGFVEPLIAVVLAFVLLGFAGLNMQLRRLFPN